MTLFATAGVWAQSVPLPSPSLPSPGTQHTVGGTTFAHSSFEADLSLVLPTGSVFPTSTGPGAYPPAATWVWSGGGIAGKDSTITAITPPVGSFAAFLQSSATSGVVGFSFQHTLTVPAGGMWRVSFLGAQRQHGVTVDQQTVRITVITQTSGGPVADVVFEETLRDATYRKYYSRPFVALETTFTLLFEGIAQHTDPHTALLDAVDVRELVPWMEAATWAWAGSDIPASTDDVIIPADSCVGLVTGEANTVEVQGELFVLDAGQAATLSTRRLEVHGAGSYFQCGLEGRPFLGTFTLVLDDDSTGSAPNTNALLVHDEAVVEMHGRRKTSWTRLAVNAAQGDISITVTGVPDDWQIGDDIVIAASDRDFQHAEQRTISSITPFGSNTMLGLAAPGLSHAHCGTAQTVVAPFGNFVLDQRAEVGMLTHNVKVVGQSRTTGVGGGGHIMIHSEMPTLTRAGFGRFSGVEFENLGRAGQLARYPIHWHLLLDQGRGQFVKNSSIHRSNNRVVTVHGTDHVLFENNVGYDHIGHGVFLEDGSEQNNVFRNNLILSTRRPADAAMAVLPSDILPLDLFQNRAPASFWITNPHNTFVGNVAAGSEGAAYWFALPIQWMGSSQSVTAAFNYFGSRQGTNKPNEQTSILFEDNSCHSCWLGLDVNDGINPDLTVAKNTTWKPHTGQLQTLSEFVAYSCNLGLYTGDGDQNLVFDRAVLADNSWGMALASHDLVKDSVVVLDSGNNLFTGLPASFPHVPRRGLMLYDGAARLDSVHFVGFHSSTVTTLGNVGAARRRTGISMQAISCDAGLAGTSPALPWIAWDDFAAPVPSPLPQGFFTTLDPRDPAQWAFSIDNPDLSVGRPTGVTSPTVVGNHPMLLLNPGTIEIPLQNAPTGRAYASPFRFGFLRVICPEVAGDPSQQQFANPQFVLRYTRTAPQQQSVTYDDPWRVLFHKQMAVILDQPGQTNGVSYKLAWDPSVTTLPTLTEVRLAELQYGDAALIGLENYGTQPSVRRATAVNPFPDQRVPPAAWEDLTSPVTTNLNDLMLQTATNWFWDPATGILWIRIVAKATAPGAALVLHTDGLGQVIEVRR